jgi:hypothetical protein
VGLDLRLLLPATGEVGWSYGGFAHFRKRVAKDALGIDLAEMDGFGGDRSWSEFADDSLTPLLNHSDCDGELWGWEVDGLADRLRAVVREWDATDVVGAYDREMGLRLADLCESAERDFGVVVFR